MTIGVSNRAHSFKFAAELLGKANKVITATLIVLK